MKDRQMGSGAFRNPSPLFIFLPPPPPFFFFFFSIEDRSIVGGGGGGGGGGRAFRIQSVTDRGPKVVNGYKLFIKSLENPSCGSFSPPQWNNRAFLHTSRTFFSRQPDIILKLFFYLFHFASTTEGSLLGSPLFHTGIVHAHLSPRLVAGLQAVPYTHCEKFCQFHLVSRSSPISSVSVSCHSVHTHQTRTL